MSGIRAKHERSEYHLKDLARAFTAHIDQNVKIADLPPRAEGQSRYIEFRITDPPGPALEVIVGDCIQNLRASLDYLVWELSIAATRKLPRDRTQFPIAVDGKRYFNTGRKQVRSLLGEHRRMIRLLQPYHALDPHAHPLALLNRLSNQDKHRLLTMLLSHVDPLSVRPYQHGLGKAVALPLFEKTPERVHQLELDLDISVVGWCNLEFQDEDRRPVVETLTQLCQFVGEILDRFEPVVR